MEKKVEKKLIISIKGTKEEFDEDYKNMLKEMDSEFKDMFTEEQYKAWIACNGTEEDEQKFIAEVGKEKYFKLLDEMTKILNELLKDTLKKLN